MARAKTYLTPEEQWRKTVLYVKKRVPPKTIEWYDWLSYYERDCRNCRRLNDSMLKELWKNSQPNNNLTIKETRNQIAVIIRPHRFFLVGDVLFASGGFGGQHDRAIFLNGVSSKGVKLNYFLARSGEGYSKGIVKICDVPGDLIGYQWDDQPLCRFVDTLRVR
ncbi:hypothetical protein ACO0K9_22080 [Undibacterium sp. Ji50W]|uniref:hypothetical protein n=1 Tax=Undibacterium sp. Ji50W TaxID=3413041 RepID=UPI003BEFF540